MLTDERTFGFSLAAAASATPAQAADGAREANKRTVLAFYNAALNRSSFDEAAAGEFRLHSLSLVVGRKILRP